jgi:hypothetical protein
MNPSNVDDAVGKFNADLTWVDACDISQLVVSVAGSRRNAPELIELMVKISDRRGYSAIISKVAEIEKWMDDPALEGEIISAIGRACRQSIDDTTKFHDLAIAEVGALIGSDAFGLCAALAELLPLVDAIIDPVRARRAEARRREEGLGALQAFLALREAEQHDNHGPLRRAVVEAAEIRFSAESVVAAAEGLTSADIACGQTGRALASALFGPLRRCVENVKARVDIARGYAALDSASAGARIASAFEVFALHWSIFRGRAQQPEVDPFAAAIIALDLTKLKELIGGRDPSTIEVDPAKLPLDLVRWPAGRVRLIEIAAAVGREPLRYLLEFHGVKPNAKRDCSLAQAVAVGDPETIRMVWDRSDPDVRVLRTEHVRAAIDFHRPEVAKWLIAEHPQWLGLVRRMARERRAFDVLSRLPNGDEALPKVSGLLNDHAKALEALGVPLATAYWIWAGSGRLAELDIKICRRAPSLLLVAGADGGVFGAFIAVRWPRQGIAAKDVWCRSFLFTIEGEKATRFPAATPIALFHGEQKVCVGELMIDESKGEYSVDADSSCTAGQFPALSGKLAKWGFWVV